MGTSCLLSKFCWNQISRSLRTDSVVIVIVVIFLFLLKVRISRDLSISKLRRSFRLINYILIANMVRTLPCTIVLNKLTILDDPLGLVDPKSHVLNLYLYYKWIKRNKFRNTLTSLNKFVLAWVCLEKRTWGLVPI